MIILSRSALYRGIPAVIVFLTMLACSTDRSRIENCVEAELTLHPESHLVDLYKYFFQDVFGPGHLISNPEGAEKYLNEELTGATKFEPFDYQELMYKKQFIRVNLRMISDGDISSRELLDLFMQSARDFTIPAVDQWRREWRGIVRIIKRIKPDLPGFEDESFFIDSLLLSGKYAVHHSRDYIRLYDPHYRIIHRKFLDALSTKRTVVTGDVSIIQRSASGHITEIKNNEQLK